MRKRERVQRERIKIKVKKRKNTGIGLILFMVLTICIFGNIQRIKINKKLEEANYKLETLQEDYERQEKIAIELEKREEYMKTKEFIEDMARNRFGLLYENEYMFKAIE